jgi:rubrerythrin
MAKKFSELSESEILALAIALEEEDSRIYGDFAHGLVSEKDGGDPRWRNRQGT